MGLTPRRSNILAFAICAVRRSGSPVPVIVTLKLRTAPTCRERVALAAPVNVIQVRDGEDRKTRRMLRKQDQLSRITIRKGRSKTALITVKMAEFAPMPSASVIMAMT